MAGTAENKREYDRYPLEFEVDVSTCSGTEKKFLERVILKDVSGGGACFISSQPEFYGIGRKIFLAICLPGTSRADARMEGRATVIRIGDTEPGNQSLVEIGISMDDLLSFQQRPRGTDSGEDFPENVS